MAQNPPNNFTVKSGTITNGLLTACLVLGGIVWNTLNNTVKELQIDIKLVKTEIGTLVGALNAKGVLIEVNQERLNSLEHRIETIEKRVGYKFNVGSFITLFKPEEEIKLKLKSNKNELS